MLSAGLYVERTGTAARMQQHLSCSLHVRCCNAQDCNGHGTHVAGCVAGLTYGVAKNATLLAVRALECLGNGTVSQARPYALSIQLLSPLLWRQWT